jgi:hypothetical protein
MHALDIHAAGVREEHQVIMGARGEEMLDEILVLGRLTFARGHADDPLAATPLGAILTDVGALDETVVRERDDDALVRDQVFDGNLPFVRTDPSGAGWHTCPGWRSLFDDLQDTRLLARMSIGR